MFKVNNKDDRSCSGVFFVNFEHVYFTPCSSVSIVKFERAITGLDLLMPILTETKYITDFVLLKVHPYQQ